MADLESSGHEICVVGSGPVGLALATDLARRGIRVLVLESGGEKPDPGIQSLSAATRVDPARHDDMLIAVSRQLGGTSNLWGARCLPFDPIDFEDRGWIDARWPITYQDLAAWLEPAVRATQSGAACYEEAVNGFRPTDDRFSASALERWANRQQAQVVHADAIANDPNLDVRTHATLVGMEFGDGGQVTHIAISHSQSGERVRMPIGRLVLAAGGIESARLLLAAQRDAPHRFGGADGPLGRYYMGHVVGEIADIVFPTAARAHAFDFRVDQHRSYVRRRLTPSAALQRENRLLNSALWPVVPAIADPGHGSAILSLVYLVMSYGPLARMIVADKIRMMHWKPGPQRRLSHAANLITGLPSAALFGVDFLRRRYSRETRLPGFFIHNSSLRYGLEYHAEQSPQAASRVTLGEGVDRLGLPQASIDFRYAEQDIESVIRTHDLLEDWLASTGFGRLEYRIPRAERYGAVLSQAGHGTHQIGHVRMAHNPQEGVVDRDLRCFGAPNLFVASTAVLPTSGQANPTLTAVALALRLAEHLAAGLG